MTVQFVLVVDFGNAATPPDPPQPPGRSVGMAVLFVGGIGLFAAFATLAVDEFVAGDMPLAMAYGLIASAMFASALWGAFNGGVDAD